MQEKLADEDWTNANCASCPGPAAGAVAAVARRGNCGQVRRRGAGMSLPLGACCKAPEVLEVSTEGTVYGNTSMTKSLLRYSPELTTWQYKGSGSGLLQSNLIAEMNSEGETVLSWSTDLTKQFSSSDTLAKFKGIFNPTTTDASALKAMMRVQEDATAPGRIVSRSDDWLHVPSSSSSNVGQRISELQAFS